MPLPLHQSPTDSDFRFRNASDLPSLSMRCIDAMASSWRVNFLAHCNTHCDTVDHDRMLLKLKRQFGLHGIVLKWFQSYLCDRIFQVVYNGSTSYTVHVTCSVPQGSVLGPRLFIMYTANLKEKADDHGVVNYHAFADDTQLNEHCRCDDTPTAVGKLEHCVTDINHWMSAHRLKQNTEKTELLLSDSKYSLRKTRWSWPGNQAWL